MVAKGLSIATALLRTVAAMITVSTSKGSVLGSSIDVHFLIVTNRADLFGRSQIATRGPAFVKLSPISCVQRSQPNTSSGASGMSDRLAAYCKAPASDHPVCFCQPVITAVGGDSCKSDTCSEHLTVDPGQPRVQLHDIGTPVRNEGEERALQYCCKHHPPQANVK